MKKSIFAIGLLSLVMVLTSFTTTEIKNIVNIKSTQTEASGSAQVGGNVRLDASGSAQVGGNVRLDASGSAQVGGNVRLDASGSAQVGGNVRLD